MDAISVKNVCKRYGRKLVLDGVSWRVAPGEVVALAAPNGAGKTTLLRIVLGLAKAQSGVIDVFGVKPGMARSRVGFLGEQEAVFPRLTILENLQVSRLARGLSRLSRSCVDELLEPAGLHALKGPAGSLSMGMKRRLQLVMAAQTSPIDLLIMDEPTNGLDLDGIAWLRGIVEDQRRVGGAVALTTHSLLDLTPVINRIDVLQAGRIAATADVSTLDGTVVDFYQQSLGVGAGSGR
ncbi:MAG: ABC transporter ATP-binding protein [Propionibacteriaceae bacterium]|jgi:ABC-2 type transport system ATP-binding protein|nr:ABC transporter ATP-binding protein [Propionibacteriaceae bacterium]